MLHNALDETTVRDALLGLLKDKRIDARKEWITVRLKRRPDGLGREYVIVISYPNASIALGAELDRLTGEHEGSEAEIGIWVLNAAQAQRLCTDRAPKNDT
jgi:hypothetical protein